MILTLTVLTALLISCNEAQPTATSEIREFNYTIRHTWDGHPVAENETVLITLKAITNSMNVTVKIESPFYNDSIPIEDSRQPFKDQEDVEVVKVFFLNDKKQFLEMGIGPHGQHIALLNEGMNSAKHSLPLNVTARIDGSRWFGEATIPGDYFPPMVSKYNAYAFHGTDGERQTLSLYPSNGTTDGPDLHNWKFFKNISMNLLSPMFANADKLSPIWIAALNVTTPKDESVFMEEEESSDMGNKNETSSNSRNGSSGIYRLQHFEICMSVIGLALIIGQLIVRK